MWLSDLRQTAKNITDYRQNEKKIPTTGMENDFRIKKINAKEEIITRNQRRRY